jgi:hypothetical protein
MEIGFGDAYAGLAATAFPISRRAEQRDTNILDYVFLSPNIVLRLFEHALDRAEADFYVEAFDLSTVSAPDEPVAAPSILTLSAVADIYMLEAHGTTNADTDSPDFVVVSMHCV